MSVAFGAICINQISRSLYSTVILPTMLENLLPAIGTSEFWSALQTLVAILVAVAAAIGWAMRFFWGRSRTEQAILRAITRDYLDWVKVKSKRQVVDPASFREWLEDEDGVLRFGGSFDGLKTVAKQVSREQASTVGTLDKNEFIEIQSHVTAKQRYARVEW